MEVEFNVLAAKQEDEMDGLPVRSLCGDAFLGVPIDNATGHLESRNRIAGMRDGDAVAYSRAEDFFACDAFLLEVADVQDEVAEDLGMREFHDGVFNGFAMEIHDDA